MNQSKVNNLPSSLNSQEEGNEISDRRILEINKLKKDRLILYYSMIIILTIITVFFAVIISFQLLQQDLPEKYFSKTIKNDIEKVIKNGGQLDIVKHIYNTRDIKNTQFHIPFITKREDSYPEPTSLTIILNDLKKDYYLTPSKDSIYLVNLCKIDKEQEEINPFDKLDLNQKYMFENIRTKLDTNYLKAKEDLNKISEELSGKNKLVVEYLDKSNTSYWISIVALIITILLSGFQIWQNYYYNREKRINEPDEYKNGTEKENSTS